MVGESAFGTKWEVPTFSAQEARRRHRKIRDLMMARHIDCLIIPGHMNNYKGAAADVRYVSNFCAWFDEQYIIFPAMGEPLLLTWHEGHAFWAQKVSSIPLKVVSSKTMHARNWVDDIATRIKELELGRGTLGISNTRVMPLDTYWSLKKELPDANIVSADGLIRECRMIKSPEEMMFVRKSGECADKGVEAIAKAARPGVTEYDLAAECECAMVKAGAELGNFILLGSGPWSKREQSIPIAGSGRKLEKGDIILFEITANYGGYFSQIVRPICLGEPPSDFLKDYDLHREMYRLAVKEMRPGNFIEDIELKVRELALEKGDFSFTFVFQTTELAEATAPYLGELQPGMAFVVHPWTVPASLPAHIGHIVGDTYIVHDPEPECVSRLPLELIVV